MAEGNRFAIYEHDRGGEPEANNSSQQSKRNSNPGSSNCKSQRINLKKNIIWLKSSTGKDNYLQEWPRRCARDYRETTRQQTRFPLPAPPLPLSSPAKRWLNNNYCSLTVAVADSAALFLAYSIASAALWNLFKKSWERTQNGNSLNVGKP